MLFTYKAGRKNICSSKNNFYLGQNFHLFGAILLYRVTNLSSSNQTWHGFSPQISKLYGENSRSVSITVLELWHFLHSNFPFYGKRANFNVKSAITQELL